MWSLLLMFSSSDFDLFSRSSFIKHPLLLLYPLLRSPSTSAALSGFSTESLALRIHQDIATVRVFEGAQAEEITTLNIIS
jgi:hypothetical protein